METTASLVDATARQWTLIAQTLDGLTDEELHWEPVQGCWGLRHQQDGSWSQDFSFFPVAEPFTTIAWRLAHAGASLSYYAQRYFSPGLENQQERVDATNRGYKDALACATADGAIGFLKATSDYWISRIASLGDEASGDLALTIRRCNGHTAGHIGEVGVVRRLYGNEHTVGHVDEFGVVRHLHRWSEPLSADPLVEACLRGDVERTRSLVLASDARQRGDLLLAAARMSRWDVVAALVELGCPVDGESDGATPLHHAAYYGPLRTVQMLVEAGADTTRLEPQHNSTPRGWAEYGGQKETADYLRSAEAT